MGARSLSVVVNAGVASAPFAPGSVSIGLHTRPGTTAVDQVAELLRAARAVDAAGFDGVTFSEHHAGFPGYLPQPLLATCWVLGECSSVWAGPAPVLLGLRSAPLLAEELAWLGARFQGRLGVAVAPGYARTDFEAVGATYDDRLERFPDQLDGLLEALAGRGPLARDPAIAAGSVPRAAVLTATNSVAAARRAARLGTGMIFPGGEPPARLARLGAEYQHSGGMGPTVAIVVTWLAVDANSTAATDADYRVAAAVGMRQRAGFAQPAFTGDGPAVAALLAEFVESARVSAINVRFRRDDVSADAVLTQIEEFAVDVLPTLRSALSRVRDDNAQVSGGRDGGDPR